MKILFAIFVERIGVALIMSSIFTISTFAADSEVRLDDFGLLDTIQVKSKSSFETLHEEKIFTRKVLSILDSDVMPNPNLTQLLNQQVAFPTINLGYPAGGQGVNLGGRSIEDTQVFTLGVPLNLPQGGGADLSNFPSFIWSGLNLTGAPSQAGYSQQGTAGSVELKLWTRELLVSPRSFSKTNSKSMVMGSYNRQSQSFAAGTQVQGTSILVGATTGLVNGPSGSLSHQILSDHDHSLIFSFIGTDLDSSIPGSKSFPSPRADQKIWRMVPVLESHQTWGEFTWDASGFGDLSQTRFSDPDTNIATDDRVSQVGVENSIRFREYTVGATVRNTRLNESSSRAKTEEWPIHLGLNRDTALTPNLTLVTLATFDSLTRVGSGWGGKVGLSYAHDASSRTFSEVRTIPRMPTIQDRFYNFAPFFIGNPSLVPEQVTSAVIGNESKVGRFLRAAHTAKFESRSNTQINTGTTIQNVGKGHLIYLNQELEMNFSKVWIIRNDFTFTESKVQAFNQPYPRIPKLSDRVRITFQHGDRFSMHFFSQLVGDSKANSTGQGQAGYALFDIHTSYRLKTSFFPELEVFAGLENLFDRRAEPTFDYPLPGRLVNAGFRGRF